MTPEEPCIWRHCACWRITDRMVSHEKLSHLQHSYQQHAFLSTHAVTDHLVIWRHYTLYHRNLAAKLSVAGVWKAEDKKFQNCKKICSEATTAKFEMSVIFSRGRTFPGNHLTGAVPSNFINRESLGEDEQIIHWSRCNGYKHYHKFPDIAAISGVTVNDQKVWAWLGWFCFAGITPLRLFQRNKQHFPRLLWLLIDMDNEKLAHTQPSKLQHYTKMSKATCDITKIDGCLA